MTLFWQHFKAQLFGLLIWLAGVVAVVVITARSAPAFTEEGAKFLESLPESLRSMFGLAAGANPVDLLVAGQVSKSLALLVVFYAVLLALNVITREVDRRTIDFLLSLPVKRSEVLLARAAVLPVNTAILTAAIGIAFRVTLSAAGMEGSWGAYNLIYLNMWLLAVATGSLALLFSVWIDDYGAGVKALLGLVAVAYFMELVFRAVELSRTARLISPFSYIDPDAILESGALPAADTLILIAVTVLSVGLSLLFFERKQIAA